MTIADNVVLFFEKIGNGAETPESEERPAIDRSADGFESAVATPASEAA